MSPSPASPPLSPSIAAQQVPLAQYAQQQAAGNPGMGGGAPTDQRATSLGLVQSLLTSAGQELEKVAKILVVDMPESIPMLKTGVQALSMLMDTVTKQMSPDNSAATQNLPMPPSGAISAS